LAGTAWAFVAARRRALIGWATVYVAGTVWAALTAFVVLARVVLPAAPHLTFFFFICLSALVVAPLATAPLALAWNRNR
jgi:hypothetical protein